MKKRLEADLISIAHRILQLKNKSDINQLFLETQKLYEKLSVLRFVEEQYGEVKPTIGQAAIVTDVENFYDNEAMIESKIATLIEENSIEETAVEEPITEEVIVAVEVSNITEEEIEPIVEEIIATPKEETEVEIEDLEEEIEISAIEEEIEVEEETEVEIEDIEEQIEISAIEDEVEEVEKEVTAEEKPEPTTPPSFTPNFSLNNEPEDEKTEIETPKKGQAIQISFEDLLGGNYNEPQFVKVDKIQAIPPTPIFEAINNTTTIEEVSTSTQTIIEKPSAKVVSLNDKLSKGIDIDLNDQIAFVKHLFANSIEDYNRVLSQIITFDNFYETKAFIEEMVKPDYNDWKGKTDYEERFMDIIEKKFL
ncbi:hypothetical protein [Flavobacterium ovatum]|uniref:hypothetical protein n=1 Tax=Flavobacterium ovatum TaxID=1928857 RepID=UPI00344D7BBE